jgi:hypothetical protein
MIERQLVDFSIPLVSSTPPRFLCWAPSSSEAGVFNF